MVTNLTEHCSTTLLPPGWLAFCSLETYKSTGGPVLIKIYNNNNCGFLYSAHVRHPDAPGAVTYSISCQMWDYVFEL